MMILVDRLYLTINILHAVEILTVTCGSSPLRLDILCIWVAEFLFSCNKMFQMNTYALKVFFPLSIHSLLCLIQVQKFLKSFTYSWCLVWCHPGIFLWICRFYHLAWQKEVWPLVPFGSLLRGVCSTPYVPQYHAPWKLPTGLVHEFAGYGVVKLWLHAFSIWWMWYFLGVQLHSLQQIASCSQIHECCAEIQNMAEQKCRDCLGESQPLLWF